MSSEHPAFVPSPSARIGTFSSGRTWLADDGVVRFAWNRGVQIDSALAQEALACQASLEPVGVARPTLIDIRWARSIDADARALFAGSSAQEVQLAVALIIESRVSRMIGNFFLGINRPPMPLRLFTDPLAGLAWLGNLTNDA